MKRCEMSWMGAKCVGWGRKGRWGEKLGNYGEQRTAIEEEGKRLTFDIINLVLHYIHGERVTATSSLHTEPT
jgi:hypothetical protein